MDESDTKHLDAANGQWIREERRTGRWSALLSLLPFLLVALLLVLAYCVFG